MFKGNEPRIQKRQDDISIEQKPHGSGQPLEREILRQGIVEVIGDACHNLANPMFSLKRAKGFEVETAFCPVRDKIKDWLAVASNHDCLAFFNPAGQRCEVVLRLLDRNRSHGQKHSYKWLPWQA